MIRLGLLNFVPFMYVDQNKNKIDGTRESKELQSFTNK